jgi:hypothetical protein
MISYTVTCTFNDAVVAQEWIDWLRDKHLADVLAAGANDAEVVRGDEAEDGSVVCEVRYHFDSREAFDTYQREHAPRLREDGLTLFPPERGLHYARKIGVVEVTR